MYSYSEIAEGVLYTVYFFAGFTGYTHPWTPTGALSFDQIHEGETYYRAWYREAAENPGSGGTAPQLHRLQKYYFYREDINADIDVPGVPGDYYYSISKDGKVWKMDQQITPEQVLKRSHYVRLVVNERGEVAQSHHVLSTMIDDISYSYNEQGVLIDKKIELKNVPESIDQHLGKDAIE